MIIKTLTIRGFGALSARLELIPGKLNLILDNNEQGKTTLVAALFNAFYGFSGERRSKNRPLVEEDIYTPWAGGAFEVELDGTLMGRPFRLVRNFADGTAQLVDTTTNQDRAEKYRTKHGYDFGGGLFGLYREQFRSTVFIQQSEVTSVTDTAGLKQRLEALADSGGGDRTASSAMLALQQALGKYPGSTLKLPGKVETEIKRLEDILDELSAELADLDAQRGAVDTEIVDLESIERQLQGSDLQRQRLEYLQCRAEYDELHKRLEQHQAVLVELAQGEADAKKLQHLDSFPVTSRDELVTLRERIAQLEETGAQLQRRMQESQQANTALQTQIARIFPKENLEISAEWEQQLLSLVGRYEAVHRQQQDLESSLAAEQEDLDLTPGDLRRYEDLRQRFTEMLEREKDAVASWETECLSRERDLTQHEKDAADMERRLQDIDVMRKKYASRAKIIVVLGALLLAGAGVGFVFSFTAALWGGLLAMGGGMAAWGSIGITNARSLQSDARASLVLQIEETACQCAVISDELSRLTQDMADMADLYGFNDPRDLVRSFQEFGKLEGRTGKARQLRGELEQVDGSLLALQAETHEYLEYVGQKPTEKDGSLDQLRRVWDTLQQRRRLSDQLKQQQAAEQQLRREYQDGCDTLNKAENQLQDLLDRAGVPESEDVNERIEQFEQRVRDALRLRQLQQDTIPALKRQTLANDDLAGLQERAAALEQYLQQATSGHPEFSDFTPDATAGEYGQQLRDMQQETETANRKRDELRDSIGRILETYRTRVPQLLADQETHTRHLEKARRYQSAVTLAGETLHSIAAERHRLWADRLNETASEYLEQLSPSCEKIQFRPDLSFSIQSRTDQREHDQVQVHHYLSSGTRDQIYLAVRLALGDYFSKDGLALPVVFDEPFLTSDDDRFARGFRVLAEKVSPRHQVLVLSCHRGRHERLRDLDPVWFDEHVQTMTLQGVEPAE
jgi:uncharacterized protein YhaN